MDFSFLTMRIPLPRWHNDVTVRMQRGVFYPLHTEKYRKTWTHAPYVLHEFHSPNLLLHTALSSLIYVMRLNTMLILGFLLCSDNTSNYQKDHVTSSHVSQTNYKCVVSNICFFLAYLYEFWRRFSCWEGWSWMRSGRYHWSWGGEGTSVGSFDRRGREREFWANLSWTSIGLGPTGDMGAGGHFLGSSQTLLWWGWLNGCDAPPERWLGYGFISSGLLA